MKLVVGLGNPGPEYELTPHNMGFLVVARLAERHHVSINRKRFNSLCSRIVIGEQEAWLIQPQTFMNRSGEAVREWLVKEDCNPKELIIIADELDLPWGVLRIRKKGGTAGHHGLESIAGSVGTKEFTRLRIGVCPAHKPKDSADYLLRPIKRSLRSGLPDILDKASEAVEAILTQGVDKAMNLFNSRSRNTNDSGNRLTAEGN